MSEESTWDGGSPWLFLFGLLVFLGSVLLFLADLVRDVDILRSLVANTVGAALLITWAAHDTLHDPNSEVATTGGAAGTALLLYGLYLFGAGVVVAVTGFTHDRLVLGLLYVAFAFLAATVGFLIFPRDAVLDDETKAGGEENGDSEGEVADKEGGDNEDTVDSGGSTAEASGDRTEEAETDGEG